MPIFMYGGGDDGGDGDANDPDAGNEVRKEVEGERGGEWPKWPRYVVRTMGEVSFILVALRRGLRLRLRARMLREACEGISTPRTRTRISRRRSIRCDGTLHASAGSNGAADTCWTQLLPMSFGPGDLNPVLQSIAGNEHGGG